MSKCRYDLSENCHNKDCLACVLDKIRAEIEQVKSIMNEEIINNDRKDLINFVNGLNQTLAIIDKHKTESEDKG